jgi:hypothetical protein
MTIFEQALYGGAIVAVYRPELFWLGMVAGVLPDVPPSVFAMTKVGPRNAIQHFSWRAFPTDIPESIYIFYDYCHSLITVIVLAGALWLLALDLIVLTAAYGLHILCDIPFHDSRFSTRFLYPLTTYHIHGYSQRRHRWIHVANACVLLGLYLTLFWLHRLP